MCICPHLSACLDVKSCNTAWTCRIQVQLAARTCSRTQDKSTHHWTQVQTHAHVKTGQASIPLKPKLVMGAAAAAAAVGCRASVVLMALSLPVVQYIISLGQEQGTKVRQVMCTIFVCTCVSMPALHVKMRLRVQCVSGADWHWNGIGSAVHLHPLAEHVSIHLLILLPRSFAASSLHEQPTL